MALVALPGYSVCTPSVPELGLASSQVFWWGRLHEKSKGG